MIGLIALLIAAPLAAQNANNQTQLRLVVVDETGAGIPQATIIVTPASGDAGDVCERRAWSRDVSDAGGGKRSTPRRVSRDSSPSKSQLTLRRGAVNQTVTLKIAGVQEEVVVNDAAATDDRRGQLVHDDARAEPRSMSSRTIPRNSPRC